MSEVYFKRNLFKTGNSIAITIPQEIAEILGLVEDSEVKVTLEKDYILIKKNEVV
jgi:antitoxin component of MazEF toxin-antitoxin module